MGPRLKPDTVQSVLELCKKIIDFRNMFDDVQKKEPEDIFAGTDKAEGVPQPPRPEAPTSGPMPAMSGERPAAAPTPPPNEAPVPPPPGQTPPPVQKSGGSLKIILIVLIVILVIVAAGLISYFLLNSAPADEIQVSPEEIMEEDEMMEDEMDLEEEEEEEVVTEPIPEPSESFDTDRDGLSDVQETNEIGTSPRISDTDADGLSDYEEVMTWKTDPLDPDTDGDTFLDGDEVSNGYDPNGDGKLTDLPTTTE